MKTNFSLFIALAILTICSLSNAIALENTLPKSKAGQVLQQISLKTLQYTKDCERVAKIRLSKVRLTLPGKLNENEKLLIQRGQKPEFFTKFVFQCVETAMDRDNTVVLLRQLAAENKAAQQKLEDSTEAVNWGNN